MSLYYLIPDLEATEDLLRLSLSSGCTWTDQEGGTHYVLEVPGDPADESSFPAAFDGYEPWTEQQIRDLINSAL